MRFADKDNNLILDIEPLEVTDQNGDDILEYQEYLGAKLYYPFGLAFSHNAVTTEDGNLYWVDEEGGVKNKYSYNGKEYLDDLGVNWHYYGFRVYDPAIARFTSVDPISDQFPYVSGFNYAENRPINGIDLHGLQFMPAINPAYMNLLSTSNHLHARPTIRPGLTKAAPKAKPKFTPEQIARFNRANKVEGEQLQKMGLDKNTEAFTRIDPKTGKAGRTIPDAMKDGKQTVEIKNVKQQSLTKQLRLQRQVSRDNGIDPILRINRDATLTKPLQNSGFDIQFYSQFGVLEVNSNEKLSTKDLQAIRGFISTLEQNQKEKEDDK